MCPLTKIINFFLRGTEIMAAVLDIQNTLSAALSTINEINTKLDSLPKPAATQAEVDALNDSASTVSAAAQAVLDKVNGLLV